MAGAFVAVLVVGLVGVTVGEPPWDSVDSAGSIPAISSAAPAAAATDTVAAPAPAPAAASVSPSASSVPSGPATAAGAGAASPATPRAAAAGLALAPSPALTLAATTTRTFLLQYGGYSRSFTTLAPLSGSAGIPMLVFLSGSSAPVANEVDRDQLAGLVAAGELSVVYPTALDLHWNVDGVCCTVGGEPKADDADFVLAVTSLAAAQLDADTSRLYLAGFSAGGKLAWQLACAGGAPFAGLATYGASPTADCPATGSPLPVLIGFGLQDTDQPVAGKPADTQGQHTAAATTIQTWQARDECSVAADTVLSTAVQEEQWSDCAAPDLVVAYAVWTAGIHVLPGPPGTSPEDSFGTVAWDFLENLDNG